MRLITLKKKLRVLYVPLVEKLCFLLLRLKRPLRIRTTAQTLRYIQKTGCSVARYGDGEFNIALRDYGVVFQGYAEGLSERLREVMDLEDGRILLCFPHSLRCQLGMNAHARRFWRCWALQNYDLLAERLYRAHGKRAIYGDADITRPYKNWKRLRHAVTAFALLKRIWEGKDLLIVEGEQTRLGVGNDLLSNARSIRRILCPPKNAFDRYGEILETVLRLHEPGQLVLLALGPTATVLAADLARQDIQALDVGHMDIEYEWMLRRSATKEQIPGKYTNEANSTEAVAACEDPAYLEQILTHVS